MSLSPNNIQKQSDVFEFDQDEIERLIRRMEPRIVEAFLEAIAIARDQNSLTDLTKLAIDGRLMEIIEQAATAGAESLANVINTIIIEAGQTVAAGMTTTFAQTVSFNLANSRAVRIMQANQLRLILGFVQEQRAATREALVDGIRRGLNPRDTARAFRDSLGLTQRQQQAVNNFRRLLEQGSAEALQRELRDRRFDPTIRRAVRGDTVLTDEQIDKMVERYRERMIKFRSEVIARTEALRAVHEGTEESFRQAVDNGVIDPDNVVRTWLTARDTRVRDTHEAMNGQNQSIGVAFVSGAGNLLRYPGDIAAPASETIQCRCVVSTRVRRIVRRVA